MKALFKEILKRDEPVITSEEIYKMFPELSESAVQAKIKRCLKGGELIRLYKGVYTLNSEFTKRPLLEEQVALAIDNKSFLSGLGALRFHNLIPEIVKYKTFLGTKEARVDSGNIHFEIKRMPEDQTIFGIEHVKLASETIRVADPIRAIMDILLNQKLELKNREQVLSYFRIEEDDTVNITWSTAFQYAKRFRNSSAQKIAQALNT